MTDTSLLRRAMCTRTCRCARGPSSPEGRVPGARCVLRYFKPPEVARKALVGGADLPPVTVHIAHSTLRSRRTGGKDSVSCAAKVPHRGTVCNSSLRFMYL